MKKLTTTLVAVGFSCLCSHPSFAQMEDAIVVNGKEVYMHKDSSARIKSFSARYIQGEACLAWVISGIKQDGTFVLYRSIDKENFDIIGVKESIRNTAVEGIGYYFIDKAPLVCEMSYYKIVHFAKDNSYFTSKIIPVKSFLGNHPESVEK